MFDLPPERDIYIDIRIEGIDFTSISCLLYFFLFFTCLNIIKIKSEVNIKIKKNGFFSLGRGKDPYFGDFSTYFLLFRYKRMNPESGARFQSIW